MVGGVGNDTITGDDAGNALLGKGGNDMLYGGLGADAMSGDAGFDYARYDDANYGNLVISLKTPASNTGAAAGDTYTGIEGVVGGVGNDTITGDDAGNALLGKGGNDMLYGGLGADAMSGDTGFDYARYDDANYGNLVISLNTPASNTGAAAGDTYTGIEGVVGGAGSDVISGDGQCQRPARQGRQRHDHGQGRQRRHRGRHRRLRYRALRHGTRSEQCRHDQRVPRGRRSLPAVEGDLHGVHLAWASCRDWSPAPSTPARRRRQADDHIIYNSATGALIYDTNGNLAGGATQFATLATGLALTAQDFEIIA